MNAGLASTCGRVNYTRQPTLEQTFALILFRGIRVLAKNMYPFRPDISFSKHTADYLQTWLADPSALKPGTQMPNLHLSDAEIDTLVTFLQTDAD